MRLSKTEDVLSFIVDILRHIETVQKEVMTLSEASTVSFHNFIGRSQIDVDEETLCALQYQDVIAQQLSAVSEAIETIEVSITTYLDAVKLDCSALGDSIEKLSTKLLSSLEVAKNKKEAFSGNAIGGRRAECVEFF